MQTFTETWLLQSSCFFYCYLDFKQFKMLSMMSLVSIVLWFTIIMKILLAVHGIQCYASHSLQRTATQQVQYSDGEGLNRSHAVPTVKSRNIFNLEDLFGRGAKEQNRIMESVHYSTDLKFGV